jgi:hypothetical protein
MSEINDGFLKNILSTNKSVTSYYNGHKIYFNFTTNKWHYLDNGILIEDNRRSCVKCGKNMTDKGHDYCIANLPGVTNACCGHGVDEGYIQFEDGRVLRGYFEIKKTSD